MDSEGKLTAEACELPDEGKDDEQLKFVPGFLDAMSGKEQSEDAPKRVGELADLLEKIADKGDKSSEQEFYCLITGDGNAIGIIDELDYPHRFKKSGDLQSECDDPGTGLFIWTWQWNQPDDVTLLIPQGSRIG